MVDGSYRTVVPVEEWLEAHRQVWSPNTVRGYATGLAQWWTFLEQRDDTTDWDKLGVPAVSGFLSWLRNGRTLRQALEQAHGENLELRHQLARQDFYPRPQPASHGLMPVRLRKPEIDCPNALTLRMFRRADERLQE